MFCSIKRSAMKLIIMMGIVALTTGLFGLTPVQAAEQVGTTFSVALTEDEPESCADINMSTGSGDCVDIMQASAKSHTTDKAIAAVGTKGKILTRYQVAAGIKLKRSEKRGCPTVSQPSKIPSGAKCIWGSRGFRYTNSGPDMNNNLIKWSDYVGSPGSSTPDAQKMKFVKRGGQWLKVGTPSGDGNCGNKVWFNGPKPELNWRQVINIRSFANWVFKGNVAVQASALAKALAKAWCNTTYTHAEAEAEGEGEADAAASARYKVRGLTKIKQWTNAREAELHQEIKLKIDAEAKAKARTEAMAKAHAKVTCQENEQPPTATPPTIVDLTRPNDTNPGWTTPACATADFESGHSGTLFFSFESSTVQGTNPVQVNDLQQGCVTLVSPTEEGWYTYKVTATDSVTGLSVTKESQPYHVYATPPPA